MGKKEGERGGGEEQITCWQARGRSDDPQRLVSRQKERSADAVQQEHALNFTLG